MPSFWRRDDGTLTLFTAIVAVGLLAAVAFLVDAGQKLRAYQQAQSIAQEAARAGADQVNQSAAYAGGGRFTIDPGQAAGAAEAYLSQGSHTGSVTVAGQTIKVTVTVTEPAFLTSALGVRNLSATRTATATLAQGVTGPQP